MVRRRSNPNTVLQLGLVLRNRQAFLSELEDHFLHHPFMSGEDFRRIQSKYSPKRGLR